MLMKIHLRNVELQTLFLLVAAFTVIVRVCMTKLSVVTVRVELKRK